MRRFYGSDWGIAYLRDASFVYAQAGQWENFKICTDTWKEGLRRNKHRFTALVSFTRLVNMRVQSRSLQSMHPDSVVEHDSYVRNVLGDPRVVSWYESLRKRIAKMDSILSAIASLDVDIYCCATCLGPGDNQCDESIANAAKEIDEYLHTTWNLNSNAFFVSMQRSQGCTPILDEAFVRLLANAAIYRVGKGMARRTLFGNSCATTRKRCLGIRLQEIRTFRSSKCTLRRDAF